MKKKIQLLIIFALLIIAFRINNEYHNKVSIAKNELLKMVEKTYAKLIQPKHITSILALKKVQ